MTSAYVYDFGGRRVKTTEGATVTNHLYDGGLVVMERSGLDVTQVTYTNGQEIS